MYFRLRAEVIAGVCVLMTQEPFGSTYLRHSPPLVLMEDKSAQVTPQTFVDWVKMEMSLFPFQGWNHNLVQNI